MPVSQTELMLASGHSLPAPSRPLDVSEPPIRHHITLSESETRAVVVRVKQLGVSLSALFKACERFGTIQAEPSTSRRGCLFPDPGLQVSRTIYRTESLTIGLFLVCLLNDF
ncbi:hypothetical protein JVU11DRAFT_10043 [Chiua virens]|nr:hypothetical protein JVU11DRAFT_10043 [Chiua virens]